MRKLAVDHLDHPIFPAQFLSISLCPGHADEVDEDSVPQDPDHDQDNLEKLRQQAGLPDLIADEPPSASCNKMLKLG